MVLAFALGVTAVLIRSDLRLPEELYVALSVYLLFAIGLKGGVEMSVTPIGEIFLPAVVTVALGVMIPVIVYLILRRLGRFSTPDAAAIAAHYGSVSAVTFTAALTAMQAMGVPVEGFMPALLAVLEAPAIVVALSIARARMPSLNPSDQVGPSSLGSVWREILTGRSLFVLLGGLVIGLLTGKAGMEQVSPFFVDPFKGVLVLFLLEMGMVAAARIKDLKRVGGFLIAFGIIMPVLLGTLGVVAGTFAGLSLGGATVLGVMTGSASYIAAPAAVRIALPQANPAYYLGSALGVTFPFNLSIGIPLYYAIARAVQGG